MKRHGNFDLLPNAESHSTLSAMKQRFPSVFTEPDAPISLLDTSPVELESSTGAMTVYDMQPGGFNWVYFPGEGWEGY